MPGWRWRFVELFPGCRRLVGQEPEEIEDLRIAEPRVSLGELLVVGFLHPLLEEPDIGIGEIVSAIAR